MPVTLVQQRNLNYYNVKDFGATGNGATDDTAAIAAAITAASVKGGKVFFPQGTYISTTQTLIANVSLIGAGIGATTIRLKNAANTDLFSAQTSSINLAAANGTGLAGTLFNFSVRDMTLDGNKANQSSGPSYLLRFYGYNFILRDLEILNGYTGGALIDFNNPGPPPPSDELEALIDSVKIHDCNGIGLQMGGPHDSKLRDVIIFLTTSHFFHFAPNAGSLLLSQCHGYDCLTAGACCYLVEAQGCQFMNCVAEGVFGCNVAMIGGNTSWIGGTIFSSSPFWTTVTGIQLGQQAGLTPYAGQILQSTPGAQSGGVTSPSFAAFCNINAKITECRAGAVNFQNEGNNTIIATITQSAGTALTSNAYPANSDNIWWNIQGLTSDHTLNTSGQLSMASASSQAFVFKKANGNDVFGLDGNGGILNTVNGARLYGYSDGYTTQVFSFNDDGAGSIVTHGSLSVGQSAIAAVTASSGTITTARIGEARVAPTAAITAVVLQAGTYAGQTVTVVNESAFTITFAAVATSNVADGVANIIAPLGKRDYIWDSSTLRWYSMSTAPVQSATAVAIATSGAIPTAGLDVSRLAPTAAQASITMQAGTYAGQQCFVINESAFVLTYNATPATSLIANSAVVTTLPVTSGRLFVWDGSTGLWY